MRDDIEKTASPHEPEKSASDQLDEVEIEVELNECDLLVLTKMRDMPRTSSAGKDSAGAEGAPNGVCFAAQCTDV